MNDIVFASVLPIFLNPFYDIIITVIGVVIGDLAVSSYFEWRKKPKVIIGTCAKKVEITQNRRISDLGFTIGVKKRMVKDARIRCNNKKYSWVEEDGHLIERKDLDIGDVPSQFFPFEGILEYREDIPIEFFQNMSKLPPEHHWVYIRDKKGEPLLGLSNNGLALTLKDKVSEEVIFSNGLLLPNFKKLPDNILKNDSTRYLVSSEITGSIEVSKLDVSIRLIGEGIEEEKDYKLSVSFYNLGMSLDKESMIQEKLDLNQVNVSLNFKIKKTFPFKNQELTLAF